jgi:hypothetical protein
LHADFVIFLFGFSLNLLPWKITEVEAEEEEDCQVADCAIVRLNA